MPVTFAAAFKNMATLHNFLRRRVFWTTWTGQRGMAGRPVIRRASCPWTSIDRRLHCAAKKPLIPCITGFWRDPPPPRPLAPGSTPLTLPLFLGLRSPFAHVRALHTDAPHLDTPPGAGADALPIGAA